MNVISESFGHMLGIYLTYPCACKSACSSNPIPGQKLRLLYAIWGRQECLVFNAKLDSNARAATDAALFCSASILIVLASMSRL